MALDGIPPEQVRLHVCWGNYAGPHHKDVPLRDIVEPVFKANAGTFYVEGANPRHEHEWEVFKEVEPARGQGPDPRRHRRQGRTRSSTRGSSPSGSPASPGSSGARTSMAGTDCGFDTFIRFSQVDPDVVWLKLQALSEGAEIASKELWG